MKYEKCMKLEITKKITSGHDYTIGEIVSFIEYYSTNYVIVRSFDGIEQMLHLDEVRYSPDGTTNIKRVQVKDMNKTKAKDTNVNKVTMFKEKELITINKETYKMMESIMNHHRTTYIDKCLDERNYDGLLKLNND